MSAEPNREAVREVRAMRAAVEAGVPREHARRVALKVLYEAQPTTGRNGQRLKPCGTVAAYKRHLSRGEAPCDECRRANAETMAAYRSRQPRQAPRQSGQRRRAEHGTRSRYVAGCRCDRCYQAESAYQRERHKRRKANS